MDELTTNEQPKKSLNWIRYLIYLLLVPTIIIGGALIFRTKMYIWISLCVVVVSIVPFFVVFEKRKLNVYRLVLLSVLIALSILGRFAFVGIPFFKPVSAIVIITGTYMGIECGFLCGALSALLSNIYFGQGPWTPFQMFAWGIIGLGAALLAPLFRKHKWTWFVYGAFSGALFSVLMDVWTALSADEVFDFGRYLGFIVTSLPMMGIYMVSNVIFLFLLGVPIGKKLQRMNTKYGLNSD